MGEETIYIFTKNDGPRLRYVLDWIFIERLGLAYKVVHEYKDLPDKAKVIHYGNVDQLSDGITMSQHHILFEDQVYAQDITVHHNEEGLPFFFASFDVVGEYRFDLFALIFYLISRYEEYLHHVPDKYGRFCSDQSLAARNDFLDQPIVDLWINDLRDKMVEKWNVNVKTRSSTIHPTFDIDTPYAFVARPFHIHMAAVLRDVFLLRGVRLRERFLALMGRRKDVFDTYDDILALLNEYGHRATFFVLGKCKLPDDQNFSLRSTKFKKEMNRLSSLFEIGMHPSLSSKMDVEQIEGEKQYIESLSKMTIFKSRQHFLYLKMPNTYRSLIKLGITHDYSMSYHDQVGFRASTCYPYKWYDLKAECETDLTIHTNQVMDATLKYYQKLSVAESIEKVKALKEAVNKVGGEFRFIWHNSSFAELYGWNGWEKVLRECMKP